MRRVVKASRGVDQFVLAFLGQSRPTTRLIDVNSGPIKTVTGVQVVPERSPMFAGGFKP